MSYRRDREWSDGFIPAIKRLVGPHLLEVSSFKVDTQQAADLTVLTGRNLTIAARVRRAGAAERWPYEFTLRAVRLSGVLTELQKIVEGWGDWFVYAHAISDQDTEIGRWMVVDLHSFRAAWCRKIVPSNMRGLKTNIDAKTTFAWFDIRGFAQCRQPILIASSFSLDEPAAQTPLQPQPMTSAQLDLFI